MKAGRRLWRTADGGLVEDGHADGVSLAYAAGDDVDAADEAKVPGASPEPEPEPEVEPEPEPEPEPVKARAASANKSRRPQGNKAGG